MNHRRVVAVLCVLFCCAIFVIGSRTASAQSVPRPMVTGPIPVSAVPGDPSHLYPFLSTTVDLASHGYVEEEYFFEGTASRFDIPAGLTVPTTPSSTASVVQAGVPYRTRMIVRRPASPRDFAGTVFMEWQNVTFGFDIDAVWVGCSDQFMRRGYAWIGVSVQWLGVNGPVTKKGTMGLASWSPVRYGTLDVTAGGTLQDDSLSYDIFSQAAQAVRNPLGADPMGGLPVTSVIAVGLSQAAIYLVAYQNAVHPLAGVFDGFMPLMHGAMVRPDSTAKAFKVLTETDVAREQAKVRQENNDTFRRWEIAGTSHIDFRVAEAAMPLMARDVAFSPPTTCAMTPFSRIPGEFVINAALDAMADWVNGGVPPAIAPDIEIAFLLPATEWFQAEIARDAFGNALGGIRLAEHDVPTATNTGVNFPLPGIPISMSPCRTYGTYEAFSEETLETLYPEHGSYVSRVAQATQGNVKAGFVVREDAMTTIRAASQSEIGKRQ